MGIVQKLGPREPIPEAVFKAMHHLDSRAVALLLKDLSRVGKDKRAVELFDWLRSLGERHPSRSLCDVYTYTAMISMCIYQQDVDRAMELVEDMRQRNIERNVHTYTALMNVCIKCGKLPMALEIYNSMKAMGCVPNVVTFNTLVDVYGKLGHWDKAVQVLDVMKREVRELWSARSGAHGGPPPHEPLGWCSPCFTRSAVSFSVPHAACMCACRACRHVPVPASTSSTAVPCPMQLRLPTHGATRTWLTSLPRI